MDVVYQEKLAKFKELQEQQFTLYRVDAEKLTDEKKKKLEFEILSIGKVIIEKWNELSAHKFQYNENKQRNTRH